ncbi:MAG: hypothetical protein COV08_01915 [Candidatus Vogelbacteria bacterium CG10_big_fil_rev_8_21_14_0_10_49_38]|uniref:Uncharacterized protein n=1 Tax=Candidatus Vogelbacteria bacterium CG10_big_fil_rev_8_21_14_0_10_49_38 TaxID=1975043 RepID=A0A2H0RHU1_9BACT|nr:MAG: hypothetical protein BK006_01935 [bacterium CG10_49_38]PIR46010.1 MAG: hypothetical protein COV08_01915 [Candidatus Vogelbacteria bacterium CG10_big_fil_rev_8_21_14_0_10_49_38]
MDSPVSSVATALEIFWLKIVLSGMLRHDRLPDGRTKELKQLQPVVVTWGRISGYSSDCPRVVLDQCLALFDQIRDYAINHGHDLTQATFRLGIDATGARIFVSEGFGVPGPLWKFHSAEEVKRSFFGKRDLPIVSADAKFFERLTGQTVESFEREEMGVAC